MLPCGFYRLGKLGKGELEKERVIERGDGKKRRKTEEGRKFLR